MRRKKSRVKVMGTVILAALLGSNPCMAALAGQNPGILREPVERNMGYRINRSDFIKHTSDVSGGDLGGGSGNSDSGSSGRCV